VKNEMTMTSITVQPDGPLCVRLERHIKDGDVWHTLSATVLIDCSNEAAMDLTLGEIQDIARTRLSECE